MAMAVIVWLHCERGKTVKCSVYRVWLLQCGGAGSCSLCYEIAVVLQWCFGYCSVVVVQFGCCGISLAVVQSEPEYGRVWAVTGLQ